MDDLTFEEFASFIRDYSHVSESKKVSSETQFERDLGLTGDDGNDLLEATEKHFGVTLASEDTGLRETFSLGPNEYLFHAEGWNPFPFRFTSLFGAVESTVREFTVGELFEAVRKAKVTSK